MNAQKLPFLGKVTHTQDNYTESAEHSHATRSIPYRDIACMVHGATTLTMRHSGYARYH